jgi:hypothetical protein
MVEEKELINEWRGSLIINSAGVSGGKGRMGFRARGGGNLQQKVGRLAILRRILMVKYRYISQG